MSNFRDRTVLVTAGSKGIGRAIVKKFSNAGATVFFTYRTKDESVRSLNECAVGIQSDASDPDTYQELQSDFKSLDVLVNNAGDVIRRSKFEESDDGLWVDALNINLLSAVRASRTFLPLLKQSSNGVIVNVSSIAAVHGGAGDSMHYGVSKAGMNAFTLALAKEVPENVRVVGIGPSAIDTDFQTKHSSQERLEKIINQTPVKRIGTPQEIAEMVCFLASEKCGFVSGETVQMTGGR